MAPSLLREFYKGDFSFIISASHRKKCGPPRRYFLLLKLFYMPLKQSLFCSSEIFVWLVVSVLFWIFFFFSQRRYKSRLMANITIKQLKFIKESFQQNLEGMLESFWCTAAALVAEGETAPVTAGRVVTNEKWKEYAGLFNWVLIIFFKRH